MVAMQLARLSRHLIVPARRRVGQAFPPAVLAAIESEIRAAEAGHSGQIRFAVEGVLHPRQVLAGLSAEARALELFSQLRIWDTEQNNGVLIYLLLADRSVAIVADRGIHARVGNATWSDIAHQMEGRFGAGAFEDGARLGIQLIARQLATHFPASGRGPNELPDEVVVL
jgi:uncharacterized membrane protein